MNFQYLDTPIGTLRLVSNGTQLLNIEFAGPVRRRPMRVETSDTVLAACAAQLTDYFAAQAAPF